MVFELYDTFGFPADLTRLMARENGLEIDEAGFNSAMTEQKNRSRSATALETGDWVTVNQGESVAFVGYEQLEAVGKVLKYRKVKQKSEDFIQVVLDRTPFYPEGGGQQGDRGILVIDGHEHEVVDTRKENDLIIHFLTSSPEDWGGAVLAKVDASNRRGSAKNHSATHLLHAALKQVLGSHVQQKGSFLNRDILRFDFAHFGKMSEEELLTVEKIVNDKIGEAIALDERREVPKEEALKMGAMALFGEKYGDRVRMIIFDPEWSVELCGGTHIKNTAEIGLLKIISESAIAAGVRRIEALTGEGAMAYFAQQEKTLKQISAVLKNPQEPLKAIHQLVEEQTRLKKELELYEQSHLNMLREGLKEKAVNVNGVKLLSAMLDGVSAEGMKKIAFDLRNEWSEGFVIILGAVVEGKALLNVAISNDLVNDKQMDAGKIVRELAKHIQGGGGGQPFFATAGGSKPEGLQAAIHAGAQLLNN
jgi:alanyl-tRNA synthetase